MISILGADPGFGDGAHRRMVHFDHDAADRNHPAPSQWRKRVGSSAQSTTVSERAV